MNYGLLQAAVMAIVPLFSHSQFWTKILCDGDIAIYFSGDIAMLEKFIWVFAVPKGSTKNQLDPLNF